MIYLKIVNIPKLPNQYRTWSRIQAAYFISGSVWGGQFEAPLNGIYQTWAMTEGTVYSLALSGANAGAMSAFLFDGYDGEPGWTVNYYTVGSQKLPARILKDGTTYVWDLTLGKVMAPLPQLSLELPSGLTLPAGEPFTILITLREKAGNPGQLRLLRGGTSLWEGNIAAGQTLPLNFSDTMPFDNLSMVLEAQAMEPVQGTWHSVGSGRTDILAGFPRLTLRPFGFPEIAAAGKGYLGSVEVINEGLKGTGRLLLGSSVLADRKFEAGEKMTHDFSGTMPYDDVLLGFRAQAVGRNKELVETSSASIPVKAGFPDLRITSLLYQPSFMPGETAEVKIKAVNAGYAGDGQLEVLDTARQEKAASGTGERAAGVELEVTYSAEMPPVESWSLLARPKWVGRNKASTDGVPFTIGIAARNSLFEYSQYEDQRVRFIGGEATNRVVGIIAADTLSFSSKFKALPPPEVPGLPQAAAFLLDLAPGDHEEITFTNLRYFKMESEKELAIVKNGQLVTKKSSTTESGTLSAFALDKVAIFFTGLTRPTAKVE